MTTMTTDLLARLVTSLCGPVLDALDLTAEQQAAGTLVLVSTVPPLARIYAWQDTPVLLSTVPVEELPVAGLTALAAFLESSLDALPPRQRAAVGGALASGKTQLAVTLRPDRGEVSVFLVAAGDAHAPVRLLTRVMPAEGAC